jgi:hypothetical protein
MSARTPSKRARTAAIIAALACVVAVGLLLVVKLGGSSAPAGSPAAERRDGASEDASAANRSQPPAPTADTSAVAVETNAPGTPVGTDIDVSELPDRADPAGKRPRAAVPVRGRPGALPTAKTTTSPAAPPPSTAATSKPVAPSGPTVQDPGF